MPELTRRLDPNCRESWLVYYGDVHVGTIARAVVTSNAMTQWKWSCEFYPRPSDHCDTFAEARAAFKAAWQDFLPRCTRADLQTWCDQQMAWKVEQYLRLERDEQMPTG
jgi:hypothetical protein